MARRVEIECDVCGKSEGTNGWTVSTDGQAVEVDLCPLHDKPLRKMLTVGRQKAEKMAPASTSALDSRVRGVPNE